MQIVAAFPGQFAIEELVSMDLRALAFWMRQALRRLLEAQMRAIQAARAGMMQASDYENVTRDLEAQLKRVRFGQEATAAESWEQLKAIKGA